MNSYPRLSEMGVVHPEQISRYSLSSLDYTDFLRIVYDRPKNSALPLSRTYRFPRVQQDGNDDNTEIALMRTNPALKEALDELRELVDAKDGKRDVAEDMRHELRRLEEDVALQAERIRALIDKIEG